MPFALSKSRYCSAVQCPKIVWMKKNMPEAFDASSMDEAVLATGNEVGDLAMGLFGDYVEVPYGDLSEMIHTTEELMRNRTSVICEASFSYDGLFCSVDILRNLGRKRVELYEVKSSTSLREIYLDDLSFQVYVLTRLGFQVTKACLVHINHEYVRYGELDLNGLFTIEDFTDPAKDRLAGVEERVEALRQYMRKRKEPQEAIGVQCFSPYACGFFGHCTEDLPKPNVFDLRRTQLNTRLKLYDEGLISFEDLQESGRLGKQPARQVRFELEDLPPEINREAVREFLDTLSWPLYYLDFETFQPAIPLYDGSRPYEQIPFQYSLHIQKRKNGKLTHKEFLAWPGQDPRRALAEQLCRDIPEDVGVVAYNMAFEKSRIAELAGLCPDLKGHLMSIHDNMKDLMVPFQKNHYYCRAMQGSYSIKYVLPALYPDDPELDYHQLEGVQNGRQASDAFLMMHKMNEDELMATRRQLLKYCQLDTYAMVKVLDKLLECVK